jgi:hypothetical protein
MQQRKKLWSAGNPQRLAASLAGCPAKLCVPGSCSSRPLSLHPACRSHQARQHAQCNKEKNDGAPATRSGWQRSLPAAPLSFVLRVLAAQGPCPCILPAGPTRQGNMHNATKKKKYGAPATRSGWQRRLPASPLSFVRRVLAAQGPCPCILPAGPTRQGKMQYATKQKIMILGLGQVYLCHGWEVDRLSSVVMTSSASGRAYTE